MTTRVLDLSAQWERVNALIIAPAGGQDHDSAYIAKGVEENHPECHLMVYHRRAAGGIRFSQDGACEIYASSNDEEVKNHLRIAELAIERAAFGGK